MVVKTCKIWDLIKGKLGIKFHSEPLCEYKVKVREFDGVIKTNFLGNNIPKENMHYTCIACITIDSVLRIDKEIIHKFIQKSVNIGPKKIRMSRFINTELKSDSDLEPDSEAESKSDAESMTKLNSDSDQQ